MVSATTLINFTNMKIIYNKWIPFPGFSAMSIGPWIFARQEYEETGLSTVTINHENIHWAQQCDFGIPVLGSLLFYVLYLLEWIFKLPLYFWGKDPYKSLSFEREAYSNQCDLDYLKIRKRWSWVKRLLK